MSEWRESYARAHIPGAGFADIPGALSDPGSPFAFTLPAAEYFGAAAGRLGIGDGTHVVAYAQDVPMWATRLWWLLRYFGHDDTSVLDGGLIAWTAADGPVESGESEYPPASFTARPRPELLASLADVREITEDGSACLVNALSPEAFRGEGPGAYSRPGRIPGSVNVPWNGLVDPATNRFRPPAELAKLTEKLGEYIKAHPGLRIEAIGKAPSSPPPWPAVVSARTSRSSPTAAAESPRRSTSSRSR